MFARLILAFLLTSSVAWAQHADDVFVGQKGAGAQEFRDLDQHGSTENGAASRQSRADRFWAFDCPYSRKPCPMSKSSTTRYDKDGLVIIASTRRGSTTKRKFQDQGAVAKRHQVSVVVDNKYDIWSDYLATPGPATSSSTKRVIQLAIRNGPLRRYRTGRQRLLTKRIGNLAGASMSLSVSFVPFVLFAPLLKRYS